MVTEEELTTCILASGSLLASLFLSLPVTLLSRLGFYPIHLGLYFLVWGFWGGGGVVLVALFPKTLGPRESYSSCAHSILTPIPGFLLSTDSLSNRRLKKTEDP